MSKQSVEEQLTWVSDQIKKNDGVSVSENCGEKLRSFGESDLDKMESLIDD